MEAEAGAERVGVERAIELEATAERFALIRALRKLMQSSGIPLGLPLEEHVASYVPK